MPAFLGGSQGTRPVLLVPVQCWAQPPATTPVALETAPVLKADAETDFSAVQLQELLGARLTDR